ncbi:MAG: MBL fold metallo-hydrolase [Bdellovibrionota bacterium]
MKIQEFFDPATYTLTYVGFDPNTKDAVVIDPVLDYEPQGSSVSYGSAAKVLHFLDKEGLRVHYIMETHAHADHLTSAQYLKKTLPSAKTVIHENIRMVQSTFKDVFHFGDDFDTHGKAFDLLVKDGDQINAGSLSIGVIHTPGHTPACVSYLVNDQVVFTGDALFMPDFGTGRCDFPKGCAKDLYHSVHNKLYELSDHVKVYVGHDYQPGGRDLQFCSSIGEEKTSNIQLQAKTTEDEFVSFRTQRDKTLMAPKLLLASIQINIQNGQFPPKEENGVSYIKIPIRGEV